MEYKAKLDKSKSKHYYTYNFQILKLFNTLDATGHLSGVRTFSSHVTAV